MTCSWRSFSLRFGLDLPLLVLLTFAFIASEVTAARAKEGRLRVVPILFIPSDNSEIDNERSSTWQDIRTLITKTTS